ncbi:MAG: DUF1835 domain-containing protein [Ekhidna sp.]|nr:DUF1835 domain-containing protein [Ekhidna sp.]
MNSYHILNGDDLYERFPTEGIVGELIVAREVMISGPVNAKDKEDFYTLREKYIHSEFGDSDYRKNVVAEFEKIENITSGEINLWFEEDLFCQTNLWFVCSLIYSKEATEVNLVLPPSPHQYGFGYLDQRQLRDTFANRKKLSGINVNQFALLWFAYRSDDIERLLKLGVQMHAEFPFVMKAIEAHFDRLPKDSLTGKPAQLIREIIAEKSTTNFKTIFIEFCKRAPIYGFGDLQVKKILDQILSREN